MEELKNYPELRLEIAALRIIDDYNHGNHRNSLKLLKDALKECFSRDLALIVIDLSAVAHACNLMEKIPEKTILKIDQYASRLFSGLNESETEKFQALQRRTIEFYRKSIEFSPDYTVNIERPKEKHSSL
jgi:hypothetical protein